MFSLVILNIQYSYGQEVSRRYVWLTLMCLVVFSGWLDQILFGWHQSEHGMAEQVRIDTIEYGSEMGKGFTWEVAVVFVSFNGECGSSPEVIFILFYLRKRYSLWHSYFLQDLNVPLYWWNLNVQILADSNQLIFSEMDTHKM